MSSLIIHQNPNVAKVGGFENLQKSLYPQTSVSFNIPTLNGRLIIDLLPEEKKKVEDYYGFSLDSKEGVEYYSTLEFKLPDHTTSLNPDESIHDFLTFKLGVQLGLVAKEFDDTKTPMCNAFFYVYDSQLENKAKATKNRLKAKTLAKLDSIYEENPKRLISIGKYLFNTYSISDEDKALNEILEYIEKTTNRNLNLEAVAKALESSPEELQFTVDVKEAISRNIIRKNTKGNYFNPLTYTEFGKTLEDVLDFLKGDESEMGTNSKSDSHYSIRSQLSNKSI